MPHVFVLKMNAYLWMFLITFLPGLELRASIPYGFFGTEVPWPQVVLVCVLTNILVGVVVFSLMGPVFRLLRFWGWFDRKVWPWLERRQEKLRPYVEKYGEWGVALFIGVPLPGTGAMTGAFGSYLLRLKPRKFLLANIAGVLLAGAAVTALCLMIDRGLVGKDSLWAKMFLKDVPAAGQTAPVPSGENPTVSP
jgi:uncharacterized membrane protein